MAGGEKRVDTCPRLRGRRHWQKTSVYCRADAEMTKKMTNRNLMIRARNEFGRPIWLRAEDSNESSWWWTLVVIHQNTTIIKDWRELRCRFDAGKKTTDYIGQWSTALIKHCQGSLDNDDGGGGGIHIARSSNDRSFFDQIWKLKNPFRRRPSIGGGGNGRTAEEKCLVAVQWRKKKKQTKTWRWKIGRWINSALGLRVI